MRPKSLRRLAPAGSPGSSATACARPWPRRIRGSRSAGSGPWGAPALAALLLAAALVASWLPGRRALSVPPAVALRSE